MENKHGKLLRGSLRAALPLIVAFAAVAAVPGDPAAQTNILPGGTLEDYGTQKNGGSKAAANVHDASTSSKWESADPMGSEYFIFSFAGEATYAFSSLDLYNKNDKKAVKYFRMFYSSTATAKTDPDDSSWQAIPPSGSFVNEKMNLINIRLGATLESYGSQKDADHEAELAADGSTNTDWESEKNSSNDYFIFSFAGESVEQPDSFVLYNDKDKGVKKFEIYYSTDPAVKNDPNHASWVRIGGTHSAAKTKNPQSYEFSAVSAKYFLFKITDQYKSNRVKLKEIELYGTRTLGDGNVWKADKATSVQSFSFTQVSGKYFLFEIGANYGDKKASLYELELMGSPGGKSLIQWREIIH